MSTYGYSTSVANSSLPTGTSYLQMHTGAPGAAGTANVSVGSTTRSSFAWGTPSSGVVGITGTPSFTNGGTSETLTAGSWWSAITGGTFQGCGLLTSSQAWASGNVYSVSALTVTTTPAS